MTDDTPEPEGWHIDVGNLKRFKAALEHITEEMTDGE